MTVTADDIVLLAAWSPRSQAYVQALAHAGLSVGRVLAYGDPSRDRPRGVKSDSALPGLFLPDLDLTLSDSLEQMGWPVERFPVGDVNHFGLAEVLKNSSPKLIIYSGYAGQLVGPSVLGLGVPVLHMHPGWLPDYRGSTTVYYSLLIERACAVSAILLDRTIDTGPILARKRYPAPPLGLDVDYLYDTAIRADLLVQVVGETLRSGALPARSSQGAAEEGLPFYEIHPVLKHLALLSLGTP